MATAKKTANDKIKASRRFGRIPLPSKAGHPQSTKRGKRGYDRKREKKRIIEGEERLI